MHQLPEGENGTPCKARGQHALQGAPFAFSR